MVFRITFGTHNADRRSVLSVPVVEFGHGANVVGVTVVAGCNIVDDIALILPLKVVDIFQRRGVVALVPSVPSVSRSNANRG